MPEERCPAVHPTLGLQCERKARDCTGPGIDHTTQRADGAHELWPNERGTTQMHQYFQELQRLRENNEPTLPVNPDGRSGDSGG